MKKDFDVIVIGARCAGAATALLLARAGARVLVVDKGIYGSDTLSTHALMRGAVMQLNRWGVLSTIVDAGTPPVRATVFGYGSERVVVGIEPRDGVDALYAPRRTVLDRALVDAAIGAGAHVVYRTRLTDVVRNGAGYVTGVTAITDGTPQTWTADLVVGGDGLHSTVAERVQARNVFSGRHDAATLYSYWQGLSADGYEWHYGTRISVGVIPTNHDAVCVFAAMPEGALSEAVRPGAAAGYESLLQTHFPQLALRLDGARRVEPVRGFGGHRGFMKQSAGPGWALVGDAGYFKDPLTAHGITDALRDAELLARAVLTGTADAFADYEATRHALSHRLFEVTDRVASFEWMEEELRALHREFSREMAREQRALAELKPFPWQATTMSGAPGSLG